MSLYQLNLFLLAEPNSLHFQLQKYVFSFFHYSILQNLRAHNDFRLHHPSTRTHAFSSHQRPASKHSLVAQEFQYHRNLHQIYLSCPRLIWLTRLNMAIPFNYCRSGKIHFEIQSFKSQKYNRLVNFWEKV